MRTTEERTLGSPRRGRRGAPDIRVEPRLTRADYRAALSARARGFADATTGPVTVGLSGDVVRFATGIELPLAVGISIYELVHPDDERIVRRLIDPRGGETSAITRFVDQDGNARYIEFVAGHEPDISDVDTVLRGWDVSAYIRREKALKTIALHDPLTELANRLLFGERVAGELARRRRSGRDVAVLYCDLDGFKEVNDNWGHRAGDLLLVALSARLRDSIRPGDTIARLGGDEFGICSPDLEGIEDALVVAHRVIDAATAPVALGGAQVRVSMSVGVALAVDEDYADRGEGLIARADLAMYAAKHAGSARLAVAPTPEA